MTSIGNIVINPPAAGRGVATSFVQGAGVWWWVVEIADPAAGAAVEWFDVTQFWRGHEYNRGADDYLGRYRASVATIDLWCDDDSLAPWNDDTSPMFGTHVELGPGLVIRGGYVLIDGGIVTNWNPRWTLKVEEWGDSSYSRGKARQHRVTARDTLTSFVNVPLPESSDENWTNRIGSIVNNSQWPYGLLLYGATTLAGAPVMLLPGQPEATSAIAELDKTCDPAGAIWYTDRTGVLIVRPRVDDTWHAGLFAAGAGGTPWTDGTPLNFAWYACDLDDGSFAQYAIDSNVVAPFGVDRTELSIINRVHVVSPTATFDDDNPISVQRFDPKPLQASWIVANDVVAAQMLATRAFATLVARPLHTTSLLRGFVPGPWGADYLAPSLVVHRNRDDLKTVTVDGWLRSYRETIAPFGCDVAQTMTFVLDVASVVDVSASMLPVEGLHIMGVTDIAAEFGWSYPTQVITPTHVQVRLRPTSSLWMTLPYPGDLNTDNMEWLGLDPEHRYQFDVRVVRIESGLVTDFSPVRTLTFDTLPTIDVPDTDDDGETTFPDPGDCDMEWKLEKRVGTAWAFVAGGTITEPPYEVDLNPYLLDDETFYRSCVRDICDDVPGAWRCSEPWVLDCQPVSRLGTAPYDDANLRAYFPQVCGTPGTIRVEEAISNEAVTHGPAFVSIGFDASGLPVLNSGSSAGVIGYGVEPFALPTPADATIGCRVRLHTLPTAAGRTLFEYDGLNISAVFASVGADPDAAGFKVVGKVTTDDGVIHTITGSTIHARDTVCDLALSHDVGGTVTLYCNAVVEGTLSSIGQRFNFGLYSMQLPASSWITDCALWDRVLAAAELPGYITPLTVTINQHPTQDDPTGASPVRFAVHFSVPVTGFGIADVNLSGTAGATTVAVSGAGADYTVSVSGMTSNGTVIATIPAGVATNTAGTPNDASTSTDNTVTYAVGVDVTIDQHPSQVDPASVGPIQFAVHFAQPVTGFGAADIIVGGTASYSPVAAPGLFTGGVESDSGGYRYHTFFGDGTLTPIGAGGTVEALIVGAGAGGGFGIAGGGGAGGVRTFTGLAISTAQTVTVGAGGIGGTSSVNPTAGGSSSLGALIALGGAVGGNGQAPITNGGNGGSGGGAGIGGTSTPGTGTAGQGNNGGAGGSFGGPNTPGGGGGGGASAAGGAGSNAIAGAGGAGVTWSNGSPYGGGGGGGTYNTISGAAGGVGGGGRGGGRSGGTQATAGTPNTGGGGGGGGWTDSGGSAVGGNGGSGIVIVRYPIAAPAGAPVVVVSGAAADYTVSISGMIGPGPDTVIATIPAGAATAVGGSLSNASTSTDNVVTFAFPILPVVHVGAFANQTATLSGGNHSGIELPTTFSWLPGDYAVVEAWSINGGTVNMPTGWLRIDGGAAGANPALFGKKIVDGLEFTSVWYTSNLDIRQGMEPTYSDGTLAGHMHLIAIYRNVGGYLTAVLESLDNSPLNVDVGPVNAFADGFAVCTGIARDASATNFMIGGGATERLSYEQGSSGFRVFDQAGPLTGYSFVHDGVNVSALATANQFYATALAPGTGYIPQGTISYVGAGTAVTAPGGTGTLTVPLPGGIAANDLLMIVTHANDNAGDGFGIFPQSGYQIVGRYNQHARDTKVFLKRATGTDVAPTLNSYGGSGMSNRQAQMFAYRNVAAVQSIMGDSALTLTPPRNTPVANCIAVATAAFDFWNPGALTTANGYTTRGLVTMASAGGLHMADKLVATASAPGFPVFSQSGGTAVSCFLLYLLPS